MTKLKINGKHHTLKLDPETPLLWALRDHLKLHGTKYGCGIAQCGACTVHIDDKAVRSCVMPVSAVSGKSVKTIENLADGAQLHPVQQAWIENTVPQCGYCQSGQIMSAVALLANNDSPSDSQIDSVMAGNLCRCGTYLRVRKAIHRAAQLIKKSEA